MRIVFLFVLFLGICLAGFAVYITMQRFDQYDQALARQQRVTVQQLETVQVAVAARDLAYGDILEQNDIKFVSWPADARPRNTFALAEDLFSDERRIVLRTIELNEPVTKTKITGFGREAGVASRLDEGSRAFAIRVDVASGVSGFLTPSDRVDVFWTGRDRGAAVTRLIIENLSLLAVDQVADEDRNRPIVARTITVRATPEQSAILAQAQTTGRLSLSLRGISDNTGIGTVEVNQDDIVGREEVVVAPKPVAEPVRTIRIRRGSGDVEEVRAE
ncbi:MAG: Flp pilus assembly protein CpaB [Pseudomonadota bacterium]